MESKITSVDNSKNVVMANSLEAENINIGDTIIIHYNSFLDYKKLDEQIQRDKKYLKRLTADELEEKKETLKRIDDLEKQKQDFISEVYRLAKVFNSTPFKANRLKRAEEYFHEGKLNEADTILKTEDMYSDKESTLLEKECSDKKCLNLSNEFLVKAKLSSLRYNNPNRFEESCKYYEDSIELFPIFRNLIEYAMYLQEHNDNNRALFYYNIILTIDFNNLDLLSKALTLNNLASLQKCMNYYESAENNYKKVLNIYEGLAEKNFEKNISDVALALNNLANLQADLKQYEISEQNYERAIKIRRKLVKKNKKYIPILVLTLNNIATMQYERKKYEIAEKNYEEAMSLYTELNEENSKACINELTSILNNLANLQTDLKNYESAKENYEKCLDIRKELAEKNPEVHRPNIAKLLNNLAMVEVDLNEYEVAEENYKEAIGIFRELAKKEPITYISDVAQVLNNLANLQIIIKEYEASEKNYKEAIDVYRKLAERNFEIYMPRVVQVLNNLAKVQVYQKSYESAEKNYEEVLSISLQLAEKNPELYVPAVIVSLINNSSFCLKLYKDKNKAIKLCLDAIRYNNIVPGSEKNIEVCNSILKYCGVDINNKEV